MQMDKNTVGVEASTTGQKLCGRCGTAVGEGTFCSAEFFRAISGRRVVLPGDARDSGTLIGSK
jgi:hypothetical protein